MLDIEEAKDAAMEAAMSAPAAAHGNDDLGAGADKSLLPWTDLFSRSGQESPADHSWGQSAAHLHLTELGGGSEDDEGPDPCIGRPKSRSLVWILITTSCF